MKITKVRVHTLAQKLKEPINWCAGRDYDHMQTDVVEIHTDQGLIGWGEGIAAAATLKRNPELVIGRSPFEAEAIFDDVTRHGREAAYAGGLDTALWDLMGQAVGLPIHRLMGRVYRDKVKAYASVGYLKKSWPDPVQGFVDDLTHWASQGFRALTKKTAYGPEMDARIITAVRAAIGPDIKLCIDSGSPGVYDSGTAMRLGRILQDLDLEFWEEPVHGTDFDGYRRLRNALPITLAGGEAVDLNCVLEQYIGQKLVDVVQPDIDRTGITGAKRVNQAAWLHRIRVIPHTWSHTPIRIAATLHWLACVPVENENFVNPPEVMLELHPPHEALAWNLSKETLAIDPATGLIDVPTAPGLGITVLPDVLAEYRIGDVVEICK